MVLGLLFHLILVHYTLSQGIDWCNLNCQNGEQNTMCRYQDETNQNECRDMTDAMTNDTKNRILGLHNYVRNHIAAGNVPGWPGATNMRQISWDDTVAQVALRWTKQCIAGHDRCRRTDVFPSVGQNWGYRQEHQGYPDAAFTVFKSWLDEISETSARILDNYVFGAAYSHYTAIVWAETYKIGCALVNCTVGNVGAVAYRGTLTCNYAPAGNVISRLVWEKGDPCRNCPSGTQCRADSTYRNLCASQGDPSNEEPVPIDISGSEPYKIRCVGFSLITFSVILITSAIN